MTKSKSFGVRLTRWMEFFADDGVIFRPGPLNAKEFYRPRLPTLKPLTSTLDWEPRYGDVSQVAKLSKPEEAHGYFFSIWKKQLDDSWKVALDMGAGEVPAATAHHVFGKPFTQARQYKPKVPSAGNITIDLQTLTDDGVSRRLRRSQGNIRITIATASGSSRKILARR